MRGNKRHGFERKCSMKKAQVKVAALIVCVAMIGVLAGCTSLPHPAVGVWQADEIRMPDVKMSASEVYDSDFFLEVKNDGSANFLIEGKSYDGTWATSGSALTFEFEGKSFDAELKDDTMRIVDWLGQGMDLILKK
jgi:hypothetical protein